MLQPLVERHVRRLTKYSRYNQSEKGRARVERYRASPAMFDITGRVIQQKGFRNVWTSNDRRRDKRAAKREAALGPALAKILNDMADRMAARYQTRGGE